MAAPAESRPRVIGLTGGIAAGKSTVASMFAELGAEVIDADAIAHEVLRQPEIIEKIRSKWGNEIVAPDGSPDRARIAEAVFNAPEKLRGLNECVHPPTLKQMRVQLDCARNGGDAPLIVIDAPLLLEAEIESWCDAILFVEADAEQRSARAKAARGWSRKELSQREARQASMEEKRCRADACINNNSSLDETRSQVSRFFREWTQSFHAQNKRP